MNAVAQSDGTMARSRKVKVQPPGKQQANGCYLLLEGCEFKSAWAITGSIAGGRFRYWRSIACEVQRDLLRFCAMRSLPVRVGLREGRTPFFYFDKLTEQRWLDEGGRAWILAELSARSDKRVVAFEPRGVT